MIRPGFLSSADRIELEACVRRQREDHGIARRANAILLLDDGESCARIAKFLYLDDDTIRGWYKSYQQDGWDALAFDGWKGGQSRMKQAQEVALCAWLEARFCRSTVEIRAHVAAECGLNYSHSGCIKLLARLGFEYRKPQPLPRVASAEKQAAFIDMYEQFLNGLGADEACVWLDQGRLIVRLTCPSSSKNGPTGLTILLPNLTKRSQKRSQKWSRIDLHYCICFV